MTRVLLACLCACTIVIVKGGKNNGGAVTAPPDEEGDDCPTEAREDRPTVDLFVWIHKNRGVQTLAPLIENRVAALRGMIEGQGRKVAHLLVQNFDGAVIYQESCAGTTSGALRDRLAFEPEQTSNGCPIDAGNGIAGGVANVTTPIGDAPFFTYPPTQAIVLWLDHDARPACFNPRVNALRYPAAELSIRDTLHLLVTTPESGESLADMSTRCASTPGFPVAALDVMSPSDQPTYVPFAVVAGRRAYQFDYCEFMADGYDGRLAEVISGWWK